MKTESLSTVEPFDYETTQWVCSRGDLDVPSIYHPSNFDYGNRDVGPVFFPDFRIEYEEHTPNSDGGRKVWKSYEHYLVRRDKPTPVSLPLYDGLPPLGAPHFAIAVFRNPRFALGQNPYSQPRVDLFGYETGGFPTEGLFRHYEKRNDDDGFVPPPNDLSKLEERAMSYLWPVVKAELSAVNSFLELKDFKSLPKTVSNIASGFIGAYQGTYKILRHILKSSADGYLQAKFNILPLLSDISGIHAALSSAERRINALVAGAGRPRTGHWSTSITESSDDLRTDSTSPFDPVYGRGGLGYYVIRRTTDTTPTKFHVEMLYNYHYRAYQIVHAQLLGHLDAFGVNLNPAIIWNAIPWSFVVDWVIGVSRFLDGLKVHNLEPRVNILRYCWSVTRERRINTWREHRPLYPGNPSYAVPVQTAPCPLTLERSYRRAIGLPSTSSMVSSGLNPTEVSLGAALVISRRRKSRNRLRRF